MRHWYRRSAPGQRKTWVLFGKTNQGKLCGEELYGLVGQGENQFRYGLLKGNPYLRTDYRATITSRFADVAMAVSTV